jgi:hypothetical protein
MHMLRAIHDLLSIAQIFEHLPLLPGICHHRVLSHASMKRYPGCCMTAGHIDNRYR